MNKTLKGILIGAVIGAGVTAIVKSIVSGVGVMFLHEPDDECEDCDGCCGCCEDDFDDDEGCHGCYYYKHCYGKEDESVSKAEAEAAVTAEESVGTDSVPDENTVVE